MNAAQAQPGRIEDWRILSILGPYRLLLVAVLLSLFSSGFAPDFFELVRPKPFYYGCLVYAVLSLVLILAALYRLPRMERHAQLQFALDTLAITLLVYITGGVGHGLGILLLVPVVGCSLVLSPRMATVLASIGTLAIFGEEGIRQSQNLYLDAGELSQAGLLGLMCFVTAFVANTVAQRARRSEAVAERVGSQFLSLSRLNENIIETMQTGVLVVDTGQTIRTVNAAARRLLGPGATPGQPLGQGLPLLGERLRHWRAGASEGEPLVEQLGGRELLPRFNYLGWGPDAPVLVLLEDAALLREQAQQMKLAALGRLSASIAHEIRNPLAAISQAGQLLAESPGIAGENQRLLAMIQRHAQRIDRIIRDVLDLSRRDPSRQIAIALKDYMVRAAAIYQESHAQVPRPIELVEIAPDLTVRFDPEHLQQVLSNLWDNSFEHGAREGASITVLLHAGQDELGAWLEIRDNGPGIPEPLRDRIFEPFFTTYSGGTGLGLYLARELCEYNQARLAYLPGAGTGACFRILFARTAPG